MLIDYPDVPRSVGRFEAEAFDPLKWKPEYPNTAFENIRPDDEFWAARIVSRFTDGMIRGVVAKVGYSDPRATEFLTQALITRRDKVVAAWLNQVCPAINPTLSANGALTFENAAVDVRAATPADSYTVQWFQFDNATNTRTPVGEAATVSELASTAPMRLLGTGDFVGVTITARHPQQPGWARPATFFFRRAGGQWQLVGVERG
jgi:hypothetical protein